MEMGAAFLARSLREKWGFSTERSRRVGILGNPYDRPWTRETSAALVRIQYRAMRLPLWLKIAWTVWLIVWAPLYWRQYGLQNFLFFCDLGNILIGIALWLESPLIFSWIASGLLLFQTLYTVDFVGALLTSHHLIGGTEYMFNPDLRLPIRLLSLFHVITPPLLLWAIWRLGYDPRGWKLQTLMAWIVVPLNYFWRPEQDVNWARGLFFHEQHVIPGWAYLLAYLTAVPLFVYFPTHLFLSWLSRRWQARQNSTRLTAHRG